MAWQKRHNTGKESGTVDMTRGNPVMLCVVDLGSVLYQRAINGLGDTLIVAHTAARKIIGILMMPLASCLL